MPVTIELGVGESLPYRITGGPTNVSQMLEVLEAEVTLWGVPADPRHDSLRGFCFSPLQRRIARQLRSHRPRKAPS